MLVTQEELCKAEERAAITAAQNGELSVHAQDLQLRLHGAEQEVASLRSTAAQTAADLSAAHLASQQLREWQDETSAQLASSKEQAAHAVAALREEQVSNASAIALLKVLHRALSSILALRSGPNCLGLSKETESPAWDQCPMQTLRSLG
jgi:hypothetical protein